MTRAEQHPSKEKGGKYNPSVTINHMDNQPRANPISHSASQPLEADGICDLTGYVGTPNPPPTFYVRLTFTNADSGATYADYVDTPVTIPTPPTPPNWEKSDINLPSPGVNRVNINMKAWLFQSINGGEHTEVPNETPDQKTFTLTP
jgi:hypothetical protein